MKIFNVRQGTKEWHEHRSNSFNASDAPAMLGLSPYKKRSALLMEYATGEREEVSEFTQKRFADGHKFEALARPLAEQELGEELFPIVGVNDEFGLARPLGASFDGLAFMQTDAMEHKSMNDEIRKAHSAKSLPIHIRVQMEQQLMVCDKLKRILFMATKWKFNEETGEHELVEKKQFFYESDKTLRQRIIEGWQKFHSDLETLKANGVQQNPTAPDDVEVVDSIPSLSIQLKGEVVKSNLPAIRTAVDKFIVGINFDLKTDEDFAVAQSTVKMCGEVEKRIAAHLEAAFAQTEDLDALRKAVEADIKKLADARLKLDKLVKNRKEEIKCEIVAAAQKKIAEKLAAVAPLFGRIVPVYEPPNFAQAIARKSTIESLTAAADGEAIRICAIIQDVAGRVAMHREWFNGAFADFAHLFADMQQLVYKDTDDFKAAVELRVRSYQEQEAARASAKSAESQSSSPAEPSQRPPVLSRAVPSKNPGRMELVNCVADKFGVSISVARDWLTEEFGGQ